VIRHVQLLPDGERLDAGICVLPLSATGGAAIAAAAAQGARRLLLLPPGGAAPVRMRVHALDRVRRTELLALVASLMRHLPVEASAVTLQRPEASRSEVVEAQRRLLDTRADLRSSHGLDLRSESVAGTAEQWFGLLREQPDPSLLVLGMAINGALGPRLAGELASLLDAGSRVAVLLALGPGEMPADDAGRAARQSP